MPSEHPDIVIFTVDSPHLERLNELRNRREAVMARYVDPNFEFPANPLAGCIGALMVGGYFAARRGMVVIHAALSGAISVEL
jgi:hypothetical protein